MSVRTILLASAAALLVSGSASAQPISRPVLQGAVKIQQQQKTLEQKLEFLRPDVEQMSIHLVPGESQAVREDGRHFNLSFTNPAYVGRSVALMEDKQGMDVYAHFSFDLKAGKTYPLDIELGMFPNDPGGILAADCGSGLKFQKMLHVNMTDSEVPVHFTFQLSPQQDGRVICYLRPDLAAPTLSRYIFRGISFREQ